MTLEQITLLALLDNPILILGRLTDITVPVGEEILTIDSDELKSDYERLLVNPAITKPSEQEMLDELEVYKEELRVIENARLAEVARVQDIKDRVEVLTDLRAVMTAQNPALEIKRIIEEDDQVELTRLESDYALHLADLAQKEANKLAEEQADHILKTLEGVVKKIMTHNISNGIGYLQQREQVSLYPTVFDALNQYRVTDLKGEISSLTPDETLVTETLKQELLDYLTSRGV